MAASSQTTGTWFAGFGVIRQDTHDIDRSSDVTLARRKNQLSFITKYKPGTDSCEEITTSFLGGANLIKGIFIYEVHSALTTTFLFIYLFIYYFFGEFTVVGKLKCTIAKCTTQREIV